MKVDEQAPRLRWSRVFFGGMLEEDEHIEAIFRRMFYFTFARMIAWGGLFIGGAAVLYFFYPFNCETAGWLNYSIYQTAAECPVYPAGVKKVLFVLTFGLITMGFMMMLKHYLMWHMNAIVMTTANLMMVHWEGPLRRECTRIDYWNLDEITVERKGIKAWAYGYGTLHFSKVTGGDFFKFTRVPKPDTVAKQIESYKEEIVHRKNFSEETALKDLLTRLAVRHVDQAGLSEERRHLKTKIEGGVGQIHTEEVEQRYWHEDIAPKQKVYDHTHDTEDTTKAPASDEDIIIEKELDDTGGIEIHMYK